MQNYRGTAHNEMKMGWSQGDGAVLVVVEVTQPMLRTNTVNGRILITQECVTTVRHGLDDFGHDRNVTSHVNRQ